MQVSGADPSAARLLDTVYAGTAVIRAGRNDIGHDKSYDGAALIGLVRQMAALMTGGRFIVLGVTNGPVDLPASPGGTTLTEAQSLTNLSNVRDINARLAAAFPGQFYSPLANYEATGHTTAETILGQTFTVVSSDVLVDGVHENTLGKNLTCDLIQTAFSDLGY